MKKLFLGAVASAAMLTSAGAVVGAEDEITFMHNGSLMRMINLSYGRGIEIRYVEPRPGLFTDYSMGCGFRVKPRSFRDDAAHRSEMMSPTIPG